MIERRKDKAPARRQKLAAEAQAGSATGNRGGISRKRPITADVECGTFRNPQVRDYHVFGLRF
jgi:hypothetical protein